MLFIGFLCHFLVVKDQLPSPTFIFSTASAPAVDPGYKSSRNFFCEIL